MRARAVADARSPAGGAETHRCPANDRGRSTKADGKMTEERWKNANDIFLAAGVMKSPPPLQEGALWTNKYLHNVPKQ